MTQYFSIDNILAALRENGINAKQKQQILNHLNHFELTDEDESNFAQKSIQANQVKDALDSKSFRQYRLTQTELNQMQFNPRVIGQAFPYIDEEMDMYGLDVMDESEEKPYAWLDAFGIPHDNGWIKGNLIENDIIVGPLISADEDGIIFEYFASVKPDTIKLLDKEDD